MADCWIYTNSMCWNRIDWSWLKLVRVKTLPCRWKWPFVLRIFASTAFVKYATSQRNKSLCDKLYDTLAVPESQELWAWHPSRPLHTGSYNIHPFFYGIRLRSIDECSWWCRFLQSGSINHYILLFSLLEYDWSYNASHTSSLVWNVAIQVSYSSKKVASIVIGRGRAPSSSRSATKWSSLWTIRLIDNEWEWV